MDAQRAQWAVGQLADEWGRWRVVRFLLMPATRHSFTHRNAARRLRRHPRGTAVSPSAFSETD